MKTKTVIDFVDSSVRLWCRIGAFAVATVTVAVFLTLYQKPIPIELGTDVVNRGRTVSISVQENAAEPEKPCPKNPENEHASKPEARSQPSLAALQPIDDNTLVKTESEPSNDEPVERPPSEQPVASSVTPPHSAAPATEPEFQIIAGTTAPHYCLTSLAVFKDLARNHGCRFLITDGILSIEIGRELIDSAPMRAVGSSWHEHYATRMVPPACCADVDSVVRAASRRYPQLKSGARCYLSVPHELDREIFEVQKSFLGEGWDVNLITEISFRSGRPQVIRVMP